MNKWKPFKSAGEVISKIGSQKSPERSKHYSLYQEALNEQGGGSTASPTVSNPSVSTDLKAKIGALKGENFQKHPIYSPLKEWLDKKIRDENDENEDLVKHHTEQLCQHYGFNLDSREREEFYDYLSRESEIPEVEVNEREFLKHIIEEEKLELDHFEMEDRDNTYIEDLFYQFKNSTNPNFDWTESKLKEYLKTKS